MSAISKIDMGYIGRVDCVTQAPFEPTDEALIFLNEDNEQTCHVEGPNSKAMAEQIVRAVNRDHHFDALVKALEELLALPTSLRELAMLDKGIGTATPLAAWLRARDLVSRDVGSPREPNK